MVTPTKLTLSAEEQLLVNNSIWILTKRGIIEKAVHLFSDLCDKMKPVIEKEKDRLPPEVSLSEPKISKGENYQQLPYVLLDYPRSFDKENIFAVRTLFWWGNFFSITLHLSGRYKEEFTPAIFKNTAQLCQGNYFICISEDQWQHHFEPGNYFAASEKTPGELKDIMLQQSFIKIACKFPLDRWNEMPEILEQSFSEMMELIAPPAP